MAMFLMVVAGGFFGAYLGSMTVAAIVTFVDQEMGANLGRGENETRLMLVCGIIGAVVLPLVFL
jgi:hypothetical protein